MAFELSDSDLAEAIADTEQEIFGEAAPGGLLPEELEDSDDLVERMSQMRDWNDDSVSDLRLAGEAAGTTPVGQTLAWTDEDAEAARAEGYQAGAAAMARDLQPYLPTPQKPDQFAQPEEYERYFIGLAQQAATGAGIQPLPTDQQILARGRPDQFGDPEAYESWLLARGRQESGASQWQSDRINSSMGYAHRRYGPEFEQAYTNVTKGLDASNPAHRNLVNGIINSSDPGAALMQANDFAQAANASAERFGGPPFARGLVRQREPLRNKDGLPPQSREEAQELDIFRYAVSDMWSGF
jgi:hypothetical protein